MDKINKDNIGTILQAIQEALNPVQTKYGLQIALSEVKFSDVYLEAKLSATRTNSEDLIEAEHERYFKEYCESIGLSENHYGKVFEFIPLKDTVKIIGLDFHDKENPVILQSVSTGKMYRTSALFVLNSL